MSAWLGSPGRGQGVESRVQGEGGGGVSVCFRSCKEQLGIKTLCVWVACLHHLVQLVQDGGEYVYIYFMRVMHVRVYECMPM